MALEYYISKHFTAEQIDKRLLQGTYDDAVSHGYNGTKEEFLTQLANLISSGLVDDNGVSSVFGNNSKIIFPRTILKAIVGTRGDSLGDVLADIGTVDVSIHGFHINSYVNRGMFRLTGDRTNSEDGLPISNAASGHSIDALLTVLDSSLNDQESCVTQILMISNRTGGDGNVYIRTGAGQKSNLLWSNWSKLQPNVEVNQVTSLDSLIDNGIYSGVYTDRATFAETFVMVVINNYSAATSFNQTRCVSQYKYSLNIDGSVTYKTRVGRGDNVVWGEWKKSESVAKINTTYYDNTVNEGDSRNKSFVGIELQNDNGESIANTIIFGATEQDPGLMSIAKVKLLNLLKEKVTALENADLPNRMDLSEGGIALLQLESRTAKSFFKNIAPAYNGVVESATLLPQSAPSYSGVYYIASIGKFAAKSGSFLDEKYYSSWDGHEIFNNEGFAIPNRIYYNSVKKRLEYFNGTSFENVAAPEEAAITEINEFLSSDFLEQTYAYGVEWDTAVTTPECTRIGSMNLHRSLPVQSAMRGCLLNDNGVVVEYLPANDWTTAVRDGSKGQVMVEIPKHYRKFVTDGTKRQVWLSMMPLAGYHEVPKAYVSAYEPTLDRTNSKLSSVVNATAQYRGGNNNAEWDTLVSEGNVIGKSLLGKPATSIQSYHFREYARNRNKSTTEWNAIIYPVYKEIFWLFVVEYATLNSQAEFTSQLTSDGYKQGGLGAGATSLNPTGYTYNGTWAAAWNHYNGGNPIINCGETDIFGNQSGEIVKVMPADYKDAGVQIKANRYRGIENPFGHLSCFVDGLTLALDDYDNTIIKVYIAANTADIKDPNNGVDGYTYVGNGIKQSGQYIKDILFGDGGEIIGSSIGGSSSTYFTDAIYVNTSNNYPLRMAIFGGTSQDGATAGFLHLSSTYSSVGSGNMSTRLCFIPNK